MERTCDEALPLAGLMLAIVERAIEGIAFVELGMITGCHDFALIEDEDLGGVANRAEAMRNDEYGFAYHELLEGVLNHLFAL